MFHTNYEINNITTGNYSIYIDIPGIVQKSNHQLHFSDLAMEYVQIDYKTDALVHMEINKVVAINTLSSRLKGSIEIDVYATPATTYLYLRSNAFIGSMININLYSLTGSLIKDFKKDEYEHSNDLVRIELPSLSNGFFIIKTEVNGSVQFYKFIVQQ